MTIPIIPGPFSALGQGLEQGLQSYNAEKQRQYEQALRGSQFIYNLIQTGQLDPTATFASPQVQETFDRARIPAPSAGQVVPSVKAAQARAITQNVAGAEPGSAAQTVLLQIPGLGDVSEEQLRQGLNAVKLEGAKNPAVARILAGVMTAPVAEGIERSREASITPKEYDFAAENFVALAKGNPQKAKELANADPQYGQLVQNGQLSDEYFAKAARAYGLMDEEMRIKWAEVAARREAMKREERLYYDAQIRGYDRDIAQMQAVLKQNQLTTKDQIFLESAQQKAASGQALDPLEQAALDKKTVIDEINAKLPSTVKERDDLRDRFILYKNGPIPDPNAPAARRQARDAGVTIRGGGAASAVPNPIATGSTGAASADPRIQQAISALKSGRGTIDQLEASPFSEAEKDQIARAAGKARKKGAKK